MNGAKSSSSTGVPGQLEQALIWFERIILGLLLAFALLSGQGTDVLILAGILLVHGVTYWAIPHLGREAHAEGAASTGRLLFLRHRPAVLTVLDIVLGSVAFYATGNVQGQAGILGFCLAAIIAARFSLWLSLGLNAGIWLIFSLLSLYNWIGLGLASAALPIVGSFVLYLALTFILNYLASVEARQSRINEEASNRLHCLSTVYEVGRSLATLDIDQVLVTIAEQTVSVLDVDVCGVFLHETDRLGKEWTTFKALHDPTGVTSDLVGTRFDMKEHAWLRDLIRETGYSTSECVDTDESLAAHSQFRQMLLTLGVRSCLFVGLFLHDELRGFLLVAERRKERFFSAEEVQICQALANQAVVAVENASLYEKTDEKLNKRLRELAIIEEIDHELGTSLDSDQVLSLVLRRAIELGNATNGMIGTLSSDGQRLKVHYRRGELPEGASDPGTAEWSVKDGVVGRALRNGQPMIIADVAADPDYKAILPSTRSQLVVPIRREDHVIGVLNLESERLAAFTEDDLHFMEHLADHAGIAIENARLFGQEQRRAMDLATLNQVSAAVSSVLDPDQVLRTIVDSVIQVTGCQKAAIFVQEHGRVSLKMGYGLSEQYVTSAQSIEIAPNGRAQVILGDEPLVAPDIETDPRLAEFVPLARQEGFRALADVPLRGREANLGEFTVYYAEPHDFSAVELDTLKTFANQAAIAIENARLFQEERQRAEALAAVSDISREIRASLDLERTLNLVLARVRDLVDYYIAEICLWYEAEQVMITWASAGDPRYTARTGGIYRLDEGFTGWIARNQQEMLIPDISARQEVQPKIVADDTPLRSYVGLPLKIGQTFIGTLEMASDQLGAYDENDLELLRIIAGQAAVAIQSARRYEETQRRFEQTQLLLRVTEAIGSTLDLTDTVRHVAREMCRALEADMAGVYLANEAGTHLQAVAGYHIPKKKLADYSSFEVPIRDHRFIEEAWETRHAVYSIDPASDPRIDQATLEAFPNQTTLFAPMVARDEVIGGVYLIWTKEKREFSAEDLQMANAIAWQAGSVVQNARLFDAQQRRVRELSILFETSAAVSSSLALDEVLNTVARQVARALNVSTCSISDWDPTRSTVTTLVHQDLIPGLPPGDVGVSYSLADYPATAQVLQERRPRVIQSSDPEADAAEVDLLEQIGQKSLLMIPLVARDRVVGLLELYESRQDREFSADDIRLGQALANQAAVAIENARLYGQTDERLRSRLDQLTALQRTTQELNATLALDRILQAVLEAAIQTCGATHGSVMLMDLDTSELHLWATQGYSDEERATIEQRLRQPDRDSITRRVADSGQPQIVDDASRESYPICVRSDTRSALAVPIYYERMVVGIINLRHTDVEAFDQGDVAFIQSLAEQAAIAIGNALRYEDQIKANTTLRQRTEQMGRLLEVSQQLRADVPLEDTLEEIVYAIQETVGFNVVLISISEGIPPVLRRVAGAGLPLQVFEEMKKVRQPLERYEQLYREEYRQGLSYFFPFQKRDDWAADLHIHTSMVETDDWQEGQWHPHDMLLTPLRGSGERLLGHISVDEPRDGRRPSRQTLEALAVFANQAAIAIENTNLYKDVQRRADNLALINQVSQALTQVLEPKQVLETVVKAIGLLLECDQGLVFQLDPADGKYALAATFGVTKADLGDLRYAPGEGLVGHVAATCARLLIPDTTQEPLFEEGPVPIGSMLCVPMMAGNQVIGVLAAGNSQKHALTESDRVLLTTLADQSAVALESARLFASTQQAAVQLSLLNVIGRQAAAQLELSEMLDTTVNALHQNLGFYRVAVLLVAEESQELSFAAANEDFWPAIPPKYRQKIGEGLIGAAAATGKSVLANDAAADARFIKLEDLETPASLSVPIVIAGKVIGVLHVEADRQGAFVEEDVAALEIAADQLAVAIENARLFQETERRVAELATINEIGRAISGALDEEQLSDLIFTQVSNLLDTRNFYIALYDPAANLIHIRYLVEKGQRQPPVQLTMGQGLTSYLVGTGQPVLLAHGIEEFLREHNLTLEREPAKSWLGVPMMAEERVIGAIAVQSFDRENAFDHGHLNLLATVASQAAVAFQNASLFQERERRIAELAVLNDIARAFSSTLELDALLQLVYNQLSRLMDTTNFYIALYDEENDEIYFPFVVDPQHREQWDPRKGGEGLTGRIIATGKPILLPTGVAGVKRSAGEEVEAGVCCSWLGVPMIAANKVLGVIAVQSYEQEYVYDEEHLSLLTTVAGQAAAAIQNASLFQDRERRINELAVLNEMAQAISSSLELDDLLETIRQQVSRIFDTTNFYIATYLEGSEEWTLALAIEHGVREPLASYSIQAGLTGYIIRSRQPVLLKSTEQNSTFHEQHGITSVGERARSWMGVPLVAADRIVGVMAIQSYERENLFDEQDLALLSTIAAGTAAAVRNAQLYQQIVSFSSELEDRVEARTHDLEEALTYLTMERDRVETLYRITSELGTTLELERVLQRALDLFADSLGVTHGTITLLDQETRSLNLRASLEPIDPSRYSEERAGPQGRGAVQVGYPTPLKPGVGLAGWTMEHRQPALVPDITQDPRWISIPGTNPSIRSVVAAPLSLGGGDILGVLTLGHPATNYFDKEHLKLVTTAAAQIAMAVNNSDLYAFITDQADQLGSMLQSQQAEAAKNQAVLESIADGVLVLDHNGRVLLINPAAEEMLGISAKALEGDHFRYILGMGETAAQRNLGQGLYTELRKRLELPEGSEALLQTRTVRFESGKRALAVNIAPLITSIGGTPGVVAALRDISREVEIERLKNEFISTVSHELRTPMTSIKGYTDLLFLGMAGGLSDAQRSFLQIIKSNADRLTALVNDILDISRIETGRIRLTIEALKLQDIVSDVVLAFKEQYREKGLALVWEPPEGLPEVRGDKDRVTQVLNNLIANAWHYTPSGQVTVSIKRRDAFLQVNVADTGIGISEENMGRIFDRFYRVDDPVVEEAGGTGLGLSIVKMFVDMLGGQIWVESEEGVGSTFSFTLPLATASVPDVVADLIAPEPTAMVSRRPKILVVEDDRDLALLLRRQLEMEGYQVVLAGSGEDALWLAREEQPQLITLDIMLPDVDGFSVLERLKDHPATAPIPVVIVSVLTDAEQGYAMGAVDYVVKPFAEDKLLESIEQALRPQDTDLPHRLLVVDDDADIRRFLEEALTYHGYYVWTASNGIEALEQVQERQINLILLDLKMPGMDGYEVIRRLKGNEATRPIPVIVITASPVDKERDRVRVLGLGASQYVTKPLSIEMLVQEIQTAIAERQAE
jgi:PAS domain S-box-containing protein